MVDLGFEFWNKLVKELEILYGILKSNEDKM